jgi:hypothetical protein
MLTFLVLQTLLFLLQLHAPLTDRFGLQQEMLLDEKDVFIKINISQVLLSGHQ